MNSSEIHIDQVKLLILDKSSSELKEYIENQETGEEALFLFWAAEQIRNKTSELNDEMKVHFQEQMKLLEEAKNNIITESLEVSLENYCHDFVLGTLEYAIRMREAQINRYSEYSALLEKLRRTYLAL